MNYEQTPTSVEITRSDSEEELSEERRTLLSKVGSVAINSIGYLSFAFAAHNSANDMFPTASPAASIGGSLLVTAAFFGGGHKINSMVKERKARKSKENTTEAQQVSTEIDDTDTPVV